MPNKAFFTIYRMIIQLFETDCYYLSYILGSYNIVKLENMRVALIPSYEPDLVLLDVVKELLSNSFNVVVVNDGS